MKHIEPDIARRLAGQLDSEEVARFDAHIAGCKECARLLAESRSLWDAMDEASVAREASTTPSVWPEVRARTIGRKSSGWFFGSSVWLRSGLAAGTVAAGLLCAALLPTGSGPAVADTVEVENYWLQNSSWTTTTSDQNLETLWLYAGVETEG